MWGFLMSGGGIVAVIVAAVVTLAYLALLGVPVAWVMHRTRKRSLPAYFLAASVVALPMASLSLYPPGSWFFACLAMATAAVGALIGYGIVERG